MVKTLLGVVAAALVLGTGVAEGQMPEQRLSGVPFTAVKVGDEFWGPKLEVNRRVTIPHDFKLCEQTGRIDNFAKAGGLMQGEFKGIFFDDSDVYKVIEGASYSLNTHPDPELEKYLDGLIAKIAAAQQKDGYLNTYYTIKEKGKRWTNLKDMHELYCGGHMIEAAVAHFRATGKRTLLDVACKFADHVDSIFGPDKRHGACGHEEVELALVKLYQVTNEQRYLKLAKFFIDERGHSACGRPMFGPYAQDHKAVKEQNEVVGHAVRAMYLFCGATDVAAATGDAGYLPALDKLWESVVVRKMYVTGGIGSRHSGEAFGDDWELPNESAYCETCAAIGNGLWNHRLNLLYADGKYADVLERVLYNGFLSGVALSGDHFFYVNPLASRGGHHRQAWYGCACCPSNVVRFLPSLPGYVYATGKNAIYVNLYIASNSTIAMGENKVALKQETKYPWDGKIRIAVEPAAAAEFDINVRIPGWCEGASVKVNGKAVENLKVVRGYASLRQTWKAGDAIEMDLPMPVRRVKADARVKDDAGRVAIQRGPVVYCLEGVDNGEKLFHLSLPAGSELRAEHRADLLGGVTVVKGKAMGHYVSEAARAVEFVAVPYFAWDNRKAGQMVVWLAEDEKVATPLPAATVATESRVSASHCNSTDSVMGVNDGLEPKDFNDHSMPRLTWWDHKGTEEWVQYDFKSKLRVNEVEVYWFDDTKQRGGCRAPESWKVMYKDGGGWKEVAGVKEYGTGVDRFNRVTFEAVETEGLRVVVKLQGGKSGGVSEWRVK